MVPGDVLLDAKRRVIAAKRRGLMFSPNDIFADRRDHSAETLWSISSKVGLESGYSPEEICAQLESAFPNYTLDFHSYSYNRKNREYYSDDVIPEVD
jgi:hypothetical protein